MKTKRNLTRASILCFSAALMLVGCKQKEKEAAVAPVEVKTMEIQTSAGAANRAYVGQVKESYGSALSFASIGTVKTVNAEVGQAVKQGQTLATLDATQMRNAYEIAKATLSQAEDGYKRMKELYDKGSLPEVKFVDIQTKLSEAQTSVKMAQKSLNDCVLKAPFSGYISERSVDVGNNVMPGIACFKLVKLGTVEVSFSVPEQEIAQMRVGQEVAFTVAALGDRRYGAKISKKGVQANVLSHTYEVILSVPNADQKLLPGMVCSVEVHAKGDSSTLMVVPQQAVLTDGKSRYVWVVEGNKATQREVQVDGVNAQGVIISGGLAVGDQLIIGGQDKVSQGTAVKISK